MYWKQFNNGGWEGRYKGELWAGLNWSKESILTVQIYWETLLNIDLEINNVRQDFKICTYSVYRSTCKRGRVNEGEKGKEVWFMYFMYLYEIEQWNLLQFGLNEARKGWRGRENGGDLTNIIIS
jgi:hypothetical protein